MEPMAQLEFPMDDANAQFIDAGGLEVACAIENVFDDNDPAADGFEQADGSSSPLAAEQASPTARTRAADGDQELADLAELELFDDCMAKRRKVRSDLLFPGKPVEAASASWIRSGFLALYGFFRLVCAAPDGRRGHQRVDFCCH
jgi:hypothetical protein